MKIDFMPKTRLGKWSVGFGVAFVAFFLFSAGLAGLSQQVIGDEVGISPRTSPILMVTGLSGIASGLLAFFTGIFSLIKYKEKSLLIYITTFLGFLAVIFLLGEFLFPH